MLPDISNSRDALGACGRHTHRVFLSEPKKEGLNLYNSLSLREFGFFRSTKKAIQRSISKVNRKIVCLAYIQV